MCNKPSHDVDPTKVQWVKSTRSGAYGDNCVEVALVGGGALVRDSKDPSGPTLRFNSAEWDAFVAGAKDGEFDI